MTLMFILQAGRRSHVMADACSRASSCLMALALRFPLSRRRPSAWAESCTSATAAATSVEEEEETHLARKLLRKVAR